MLLHKPPGIVGVQRRPPIYAEGPQPFSGQGNIADSWALTINGTRVAPTCVYLPSDINTGDGSWAEHFGAAAGAMTLQAGSPTYDVDSLLGVNGSDEGVKGDGTAWWKTGGNDFGNIASKDGHIGCVFYAAPDVSTYYMLASKRAAAGDTEGWSLYQDVAGVPGRLSFAIKDTDGQFDVLATAAALTAGSLVVVDIFWDCDVNSTNGIRLYLNGALADSGNLVGSSIDMDKVDPAAPLQLMKWAGYPAKQTLLAFDMHLSSSWFAGATNDVDWLAAHQERFARWTGYYAQHSIPGAYVPTVTRATTKYYYRSSQSLLHLAGSGLLAIDEDGKYVEGAATNVCEDFDPNGQWYIADATDDAGSESPFKGVSWTDVTEAATTATHGYISGTGPAVIAAYAVNDGEYISWQFAVKPGARRYLEFLIYLHGGSYTGAAAFLRFDTNDGSVLEVGNTAGAGRPTYIDSSVEQCGGAYRIRLIGRNEYGSPLSYRLAIFGSVTDDAYAGPESYAGNDAAVAFSCAGMTAVVAATPYYGSPILTAGAPVTRNADNVDLPAAIATRLNAAGQGTIEFEFSITDATRTSQLFDLHDGTANNRIHAFVYSNGKPYYQVIKAGGVEINNFCGGALAVGTVHRGSVSFRNGRLSMIVNGVRLVADGDVPSGVDEFYLGRTYGNTNHLNGHIRITKILDYATH